MSMQYYSQHRDELTERKVDVLRLHNFGRQILDYGPAHLVSGSLRRPMTHHHDRMRRGRRALRDITMTKQIDTRLKRLEERLIHMWPEESRQQALIELAALLGVKPEQMPPAPDAEIARWAEDQICQRRSTSL